MAPGGDELAAIGLGDAGVSLRPLDAGGLVGAPHGHALAALNPACRPAVQLEVVIEGGEVGVGCAVVTIVVEHSQLFRRAVGKAHPVEPAQIGATDDRRHDVVGERDTPHREGIGIGCRLRVGAVGGNDEGGVVLDRDFANGSPILDGERARDPDDRVLVLGRVEVDPAEAVGGLLGKEWKSGQCEREDACGPPGRYAMHESRYNSLGGGDGELGCAGATQDSEARGGSSHGSWPFRGTQPDWLRVPWPWFVLPSASTQTRILQPQPSMRPQAKADRAASSRRGIRRDRRRTRR